MNCKQGDLAIVVRGYPASIGNIVRCLRPYGGAWFGGSAIRGWETDGRVINHHGTWQSVVADDSLYPLRDTDGVDEMLRITGLPIKETHE